jgi:hypothetical protein
MWVVRERECENEKQKVCVFGGEVLSKPNQTKLTTMLVVSEEASETAVYTVQSIVACSMQKRRYNGIQGMIG